MNVDLIISHPIHLDYPLWRQFIHDNRSRFEKVIVVFTDMHTGKDYRRFLRDQFNKDGVISINSSEVLANQDWRDVAVRTGLGESDAKWVWFTEQDFLPNPDLWNELDTIPKAGVICVSQEKRLHPCCLFIRRELLNKTSKDFAANPPSHDHFGQIQKDLQNMVPPITIHTINPKFYQHMNGLSQNLYLLQSGEQPNYEPEKFKEYCRTCLQIDLPIEPEIRALMKHYADTG